jgi:hypothetical protein
MLKELEAELNTGLDEQLFSLEGVPTTPQQEWPRIYGFTQIKVMSIDREALAFAPYILAALGRAMQTDREIWTTVTPLGRQFVFEEFGAFWSVDYETPGLLKNKDNGTYRISQLIGDFKRQDKKLLFTSRHGEVEYWVANAEDFAAELPTCDARKQSKEKSEDFYKEWDKIRGKGV